MEDGSSTSSTHSGVLSLPNSVYICLITLELASIGIKYQGLTTNPFQERSATMLLFLAATLCHAIVLTAAPTGFPTVIMLHVSGVIACDALLWVLVAQLFWFIAINALIVLVLAFILHYIYICELLVWCYGKIIRQEISGATGQIGLNTAAQMVDLEAKAITSGLFRVGAVLNKDSCTSFMVKLIPLLCRCKIVEYTASKINGAPIRCQNELY